VGKPALVPWLSAFPPGAPPTPLEGYYLSFLFAADGSGVYLCLQQNAAGQRTSILKQRVQEIRRLVGPLPSLSDSIDLKAASSLPRKYEAGAIYSKYYGAGTISWEGINETFSTVIETITDLRHRSFTFERS
jgi:hypothetical protein